METEDLKKDRFTSAINSSPDLDLGGIIKKHAYSRETLKEANQEIESIFDPAQAYVSNSQKLEFESEMQSYFKEKRGEISKLSEEKESAKSSLRIQYEAEVESIKKRLGDLELIRKNLGLSQRKICQLLLVDPSAWTRWRKNESDAPLSIYRALEWYCILKDRHPAMGNSFWLNTSAVNENEKKLKEIKTGLEEKLNETLVKSIAEVQAEIASQKRWILVLSVGILAALFGVIFLQVY